MANLNGTDDLEEEPISGNDDTELEDGNEEDAAPPPNRYNVSSFRWDSDVEGLVKCLKHGDIYIPNF